MSDWGHFKMFKSYTIHRYEYVFYLDFHFYQLRRTLSPKTVFGDFNVALVFTKFLFVPTKYVFWLYLRESLTTTALASRKKARLVSCNIDPLTGSLHNRTKPMNTEKDETCSWPPCRHSACTQQITQHHSAEVSQCLCTALFIFYLSMCKCGKQGCWKNFCKGCILHDLKHC